MDSNYDLLKNSIKKKYNKCLKYKYRSCPLMCVCG